MNANPISVSAKRTQASLGKIQNSVKNLPEFPIIAIDLYLVYSALDFSLEQFTDTFQIWQFSQLYDLAC
jgi:hypothetical protein